MATNESLENTNESLDSTEEVTRYSISAELLLSYGDNARRMRGVNTKFTPARIIEEFSDIKSIEAVKF